MRRVLSLFAAVLTLGVGTSQAQETATAIRAGRLLDGSGGAPIEDAVVLVRDGRIEAVGANVQVPANARLLDLSDYTVLPGLIDAHVHMTGRHIGEGRNWEHGSVRDLPQEDAIRGVRNARLTLEAGFTTVRNVGAGNFSDVALRNMIDAGVVPGPRMLVAAHSLGITGGHCDTNGYVPGLFEPDVSRGIADGADEVRAAVRYQIKYGADLIKTCATGGVLSEGDAVGVQQYTVEELTVMVEEAGKLEHKVAAHAHGTEGIKAAVRAGVTSIEHGSILDDEAVQMMLERRTYLVPTLMAGYAVERQAQEGILSGLRAEKALYIAPIMRRSFRLAVEGGVPIAFGTDAGVFPHGTNAREFALMVENGMDPMRALVAATSAAADLLGVADERGTLEAGKLADIIAVEGDPLRDMGAMERVVFVMKEGQIFKRPAAVTATR